MGCLQCDQMLEYKVAQNFLNNTQKVATSDYAKSTMFHYSLKSPLILELLLKEDLFGKYFQKSPNLYTLLASLTLNVAYSIRSNRFLTFAHLVFLSFFLFVTNLNSPVIVELTPKQTHVNSFTNLSLSSKQINHHRNTLL